MQSYPGLLRNKPHCISCADSQINVYRLATKLSLLCLLERYFSPLSNLAEFSADLIFCRLSSWNSHKVCLLEWNVSILFPRHQRYLQSFCFCYFLFCFAFPEWQMSDKWKKECLDSLFLPCRHRYVLLRCVTNRIAEGFSFPSKNPALPSNAIACKRYVGTPPGLCYLLGCKMSSNERDSTSEFPAVDRCTV